MTDVSSEPDGLLRRRPYLDWLRGVAVLVMIEAHLFDAWTAPADRSTYLYRLLILMGGFGAPAFLFLAGIATSLAMGARLAKGMSTADALRLARRRGWQIFGLAFLFRLQSWAISRGPLPWTLLKVDILNIMGLSLVAAAALWGLPKTRGQRIVLFAGLAAALAAIAPAVRATPLLEPLPDPLEWYFRPWTGRSSFTLTPWPAFLLAGVAAGEWLGQVRSSAAEARATWQLGAVGLVLVAAGYAATFFPPAYDDASLWTIAPSFVGVRLGVLLLAVPLAHAWNARRSGWSPLEEFGLSSLFVYWIHVEMVYGILTLSIHKRLSIEQACVAYVLFCLLLFGLVRLKNWITKASGPLVGRLREST